MATAPLTTPRALSARQSLENLVRCADAIVDTPTWWECISVQLTGLRDELAAQDIASLVNQVTAECPERGIRAARTRLQHDDLQVDAGRVHRMVTMRRGPYPSAQTIRTELKRLLVRARKVDEQTDALLLDAYALDIGVGD